MSKKVSMEAFFLDQGKVDKGLELPIVTPSGDKATLFIRSRWSDPVRRAMDESQRAVKKLARKTGEVSIEDERDSFDRLVASMISDWTCAEECTPENALAFVKNAPYLTEAIDRKSGQNSLFFPDAREPSSSGQKKK